MTPSLVFGLLLSTAHAERPAPSTAAAGEAVDSTAGPSTLLAAANQALAKGELSTAESAYRALLAGGYTGGEVWYDLGNVLYRQGRSAQAIHAWKSASARLPRDPDVQANLEFARRTLPDGVVAEQPRPWFAPWQAALTPEEGSWLGAALAGLGLLAVAGRRTRPAWPLVPVGVGAVAVGALVAAGGYSEAASPPLAVVLASETVVTSDLGGGVHLFTLHAGAEVQTVEQAAERVLVTLPDGRKGWLAASAVGIVDPSQPPPVL